VTKRIDNGMKLTSSINMIIVKIPEYLRGGIKINKVDSAMRAFWNLLWMHKYFKRFQQVLLVWHELQVIILKNITIDPKKERMYS